MSKSIFNVSEEEKNRIRNLHITESSTKKIDSTLNEQDEKKDIRVDEPVVGDDMVKTDISIMDKEVVPSDDEGLQQYQMPAHYHVFRWCKQGGPIVFYPPPAQSGIQGTALQQASITFYNMMGSPSVGEIIHITLDPSLPQRRMCYEYLGFEVRQGGQYGNLDGAATHWFAPNAVRDPGSYTTCQDCEQGGPQGGTIDCINCTLGQMTQVSQTQGCPQGYSPVNSLSQGPCTECQQGNCTNIGWGYGQGMFNSMAECQASPTCTNTGYECVNNSCAQTPGGQYTTLTDCQNSGCGQQTATYNCTDWADPNGCVDPGNGSGQFPTLDDCLISPCQCDSIILAWPLYLNNPNNPQGNWNGSPHDGPSNPNALSNQLSNIQNSNGYNSNNVTVRQRMRCREAAIQLWLSNSTNIACCADPGFAVGASNADPLGCVTSNFISTMNNFMVQHSNWPNNGCNWLTNALTNAQNQQAQYNSGSNAYCKLQGKINFLTNFINTTQSTYLTGTATFTPGC